MTKFKHHIPLISGGARGPGGEQARQIVAEGGRSSLMCRLNRTLGSQRHQVRHAHWYNLTSLVRKAGLRQLQPPSYLRLRAGEVRSIRFVAIDSATTHAPGLRVHIRNTLESGDTKEETMEISELVSILGMHTISIGVPVLHASAEPPK